MNKLSKFKIIEDFLLIDKMDGRLSLEKLALTVIIKLKI